MNEYLHLYLCNLGLAQRPVFHLVRCFVSGESNVTKNCKSVRFIRVRTLKKNRSPYRYESQNRTQVDAPFVSPLWGFACRREWIDTYQHEFFRGPSYFGAIKRSRKLEERYNQECFLPSWEFMWNGHKEDMLMLSGFLHHYVLLFTSSAVAWSWATYPLLSLVWHKRRPLKTILEV